MDIDDWTIIFLIVFMLIILILFKMLCMANYGVSTCNRL